MTNRIAIWLVLIIGAGVAWDVYANETQAIIFLGRKLLDLIQYLAIWR